MNDQLTAGIRTQPTFFTERLFKIAEMNLNGQTWHPFKDSNLRMLESKSSALDQLGERGI